MAQANIAKTSIQFSTDTSELDKGLAAARVKTAAAGADIEKKMAAASKAANAKLSQIGEKTRALAGQAGGLGGVGEFLGVGGGIGVLVAGANAVATMAADVGNLKTQLEESARLSEKMDKVFGHMLNAQKVIDKTRDMADTMTAGQRVGILSKEFSQSEKNASGLETQLNKAKQELADMDTFLERQLRGLPGIVGTARQEAFDEKKQQVEELRKKYDEAKEAGKALRDEIKAVRQPSQTPEVIKAVAELEKNLRIQKATFGQTADQVSLYQLKLKGATDAQLKMSSALAAQLEAMRKQKEIKDNVDELTKSLRFQIETWGQSAEQVQIAQAKAKGATDAQLAQAQRAARVIAALRERDALLEERKQLLEKQGDKPELKIADVGATRSTSAEGVAELARAKLEARFGAQLKADEQKKTNDLLKSIDEKLARANLVIKGGDR